MEGREVESFTAVYRRGDVVVPALRESNSLYQSGYGSLLGEEGVLTLNPCETLFLVERGKLSVICEETREVLHFGELLASFIALDRLIWTKYLVYRDLRSKGYVVREGYGLGVDFLLYERGAFGKRPPKYLVYGIWEGEPKKMRELMEVVRFAEEKGKILKLAVIDRRGEVVYYTLQELELRGESLSGRGVKSRGGGGP
mgnify:CR=1 FL=1